MFRTSRRDGKDFGSGAPIGRASCGCWISGSKPSAFSSARRYVRTGSAAAVPSGCGSRAIAATCFIALIAEKASGGASAGNAAGGCWCESALPHTIVTKSLSQ
jgi:hypothetical protein